MSEEPKLKRSVVKVKGTKAELEECGDWFLMHPHLQLYIRHLEVWVPVWEMKQGRGSAQTNKDILLLHERGPQPRVAPSHWPIARQVTQAEESNNINLAYQLASHNATLDEILACVRVLFPQACALTIEGGHCKKPPKIQYFREPKYSHATLSKENQQLSSSGPPSWTSKTILKPQLSILSNISTLVLKGAWNIIRTEADFYTLSRALPNLREWHCSYSKPKPDACTAMCAILRHFPPTIARLNICLEGLYAKEDLLVNKLRKLSPADHLCLDLGQLSPQLESLTYTGRVCAKLFQSAGKTAIAHYHNRPRLRSIDLVVTNCCREDSSWSEGTGVNNWEFIQLFEKLVTEACRILQTYPDLAHLRIRFIDLDSPNPLMNPYFHLLPNGTCTGVWNEDILSLLHKARPNITFEGLEEEGGLDETTEGTRLKVRPRSIPFRKYLGLADPVNM